MFLPFLVRGTPYNGQHMRFLRAVCGRRAALCGETEGRTPTRDAASRAVDPLPLQSAATACALRESGPPARFPGFGAPNVSQNHAPCTVSKRVGFAKRKKGRTPTRDAASRAVAPSFLRNPQRRLCRHATHRHRLLVGGVAPGLAHPGLSRAVPADRLRHPRGQHLRADGDAGIGTH